ncbi:MFS transporter [Polaromonas jejuensis]|uniref:MFS transporter n=1 Tax=Polaromonas jejuensis TaxID=457502 RepID=A0ABW0QE38_9BURK|nr:MFS transporter [Polaromonas jejuensis]
MTPIDMDASPQDGYLVGKKHAWFAFAMTFALMMFDYIDRQVIASLFPHIKAEWNLSDKELGGLVSIISIVVAIGSIPVALLADRLSRVKSVAVMATTWSLATISCMFAGSYAQLFAARAVVGAGEAGYGSVGAALISSLFPKRLRGALLGAFFAAASLGSVLGVLLGGMIAAKWGWKTAFGVVGVPGLVLALLYLLVRDYKTVALTPKLDRITQSAGGTIKHIFRTLARTRTLLWVCLGGAMQLVVVSAVWSWMPSFLNRFHGMAPHEASKQAALIILVSALGNVFWGYVVDRTGLRRARNKLTSLAVLCVITMVVFLLAFSATQSGAVQIKLILLGGFFMTCTLGAASGVVIDVIHPGVRSTGSAVLALFQNLLGLAIGPVLVGALSDKWGLQQAMQAVSVFSMLAAVFFVIAARCYDHDVRQVEGIHVDALPA